MKKVTFICLLPVLLFPARILAAEEWQIVYPKLVAECLQKPSTMGFEVTPDVPPYYLRGDFDGDGKPDYAVAGRGKKTRRRGILICDARGRTFILGADQPLVPAFSTMPNDNFVAGNWVVYSKAETITLTNSLYNAPRPLPNVIGETIGMIFEDATALIYWDGRQFRWAPPRE